MIKRIADVRYGGLSNEDVFEFCTKLQSVAATLPETDNFEERREASYIALRMAHRLAQADPHTPLSDALFALARAIDLYIHFRTPVGKETIDLADALDQTMKGKELSA